MRRIIVAGLVVWVGLGLFLTTLPDSPEGVFSQSHVLFAAVLGFGLASISRRLRRPLGLVAIGALAVVGGIGVELVQSLDTVGRQVAALDVAAGTVGALLGSGAALGLVHFAANRALSIATLVLGLAIVAFAVGPVRASAPVRKLVDCRSAPDRSTVERTLAANDGTQGIERAGQAVAIERGPGRTTDPNAKDLVLAMICAQSFRVVATVHPSTLEQLGPRRIVAITEGWQGSRQNLVVGMQGQDLAIRVRIRRGEFQEFVVPDVFTANTSVSLDVRYRSGRLTVEVDGEPRFDQRPLRATLSNWSRDYRLHVGNEATDDRRFEGTITNVAIGAT